MCGDGHSRQENNSSCKNSNSNELKYLQMKLHLRYITGISLGIVVWMVASGAANNTEFSSWISFASTVTSIILSVIAIIMSITGESKTDAMRNQMEETAQKLEETANAIEAANKKNEENINELKENIHILQEKVVILQGKTEAYMKNFVANDGSETAKSSNAEWEDH